LLLISALYFTKENNKTAPF